MRVCDTCYTNDKHHDYGCPKFKEKEMKRYSINQIKYYLAGMIFVPGANERNASLDSAIALIDDGEDGIEAVLERKREDDRSRVECWKKRTIDKMTRHLFDD